MKSNIELLWDLEDAQVSFINSKSLDYFQVLIQALRKCKLSIPSKQKEFPWTYPKIQELKDQLEQNPNCLSEIYYLNSLLKEADVRTEDNVGLLVFSNNQGMKLLDKKGFGTLKYLLKADVLFRQSKQIKNELDQGILDKAITDFFKQINEHTLKTNDDETRRQMDAIDRMMFALQDEGNQNMNETKKQLERELHNYEQHQSNLRNLENDIRKTKKRIQNLSIQMTDGDNSEVMLESDDKLNDLLEIERNEEKTIEWNRFDRNREQRDFDVLTKHLCDENEALNKLKVELEDKQNVQTTLENRNAEIEALKFAKSQYERRIGTLKKEKYYRPHEECTEFPKNNYTCHYIAAVREAVHFVLEKLEIGKNIDTEATKLELLKKLSEHRYDHSVRAIVGGKANGKHVKDLKTVVDKIVSRIEVLEREATDIATDEIIEISNGNLQKFRQGRLSNLLILVNTKEAIKLIESTMKQKQDLIHLLKEKKSLAAARVRFSEGYDSIKRKYDLTEQIRSYKIFLNSTAESHESSIFLRQECLKQLKILKDYRSYLNDESQSKTLSSEMNPITQDSSNIENNSQYSYTTDRLTENQQQQLDRLRNDLYNLEQQKKQIEYHIQKDNILLVSSKNNQDNDRVISEINTEYAEEDTDAKPIQVKKHKISVNSSISYREIHQNLKDKIERELKCQIDGLIFEQDCLKSLIIDRIKINYQEHEWNNKLNSRYENAVDLLNKLKINYRDIVYCYVEQIEIQCCGTFLLDSNDHYRGIDLIIRARKMKCGKQGESVNLVTTGLDAPEFVFPQASDGCQRRRHEQIPESHSGFDGGKGAVGQSGGNADKGYRGKDGDNGVADDTRGFGGGQTTFGFGQKGTNSGDGGNAGFSGRGGRAGQAGKLSKSDSRDNLYEILKDQF
ncbi:unnamed protein product, partial [Rotaria magnacalcarata]